MKRSSSYLAIFGISLGAIVLEIAYTRVFSFKVYYYFTYLIIGLAMTGLGAGAVAFMLLSPLRRMPLARLLARLGGIAAALVLAGYWYLAPLPLPVSNFSEHPGVLLDVAVAALVLFLPFSVVGVAVTAILSEEGAEVHRRYAADLLGAGLGCALAVPAMVWLTPPGAIACSAALFTLSTLPAARIARERTAGIASLGLAAVAVVWTVQPNWLPDPVVDPAKKLRGLREAGLVIHSEWSPVFRIDVALTPMKPDGARLIQHEGQLGSTIHPFNGDVSSLSRFESDSRAFPFELAPPAPRTLIIGSAGGHEILSALYFGAEHVTGVELNPATLALLTDHFADFSGRLGENDRVTLVNAEGRSYLKQANQTYDLIWLVAPDSYAAMNAASSGAFVLSESYLYTVEMVREALSHLSPNGVLAAQFGETDFLSKPNRTTRFVATVRETLQGRGVEDVGAHIAVLASWEGPAFSYSTVLVSPRPLDPARTQALRARAPRVGRTLVAYLSGQRARSEPLLRTIRMSDDELQRWQDQQPYQLGPVWDNSPFFWHFVRFRDAFTGSERGRWDWEDAVGERMLASLLVLVTLLAACFLILPLIVLRRIWREVPLKTNAGLYFAAIGMGFMFIEVCLIQMLTLYLGYPTYALSVTLFGLLVFAGIGSLMSGRWLEQRNRSLVALLVLLAGIVLFLQLGFPLMVDATVGAALPIRLLVTVAMLAPVGLCLGHFMPLGLESVAALGIHPKEYVAWAWAVNGFFSVITSVLSTILAMSFGFTTVLAIGLSCYLIGVASLWRIPASR